MSNHCCKFRKLEPLPHTSVTFNDRFWSPRLKVNREVTIPHNLKMIRETGRLDNFLKAAGKMKGEFRGFFFNDSDVYKWMEAVALSLATHLDPKLEADLNEAIDAVAAAQQPNGYLNTYFTLREPDKRWTNTRLMHELYCAGHLIEAAVAHFNATGKRTLLNVACRFADCIDGIFGPGKRRGAPGHEEVELALVKLYHATGETRYLKLAQFFLDTRGTEPSTFLAEITNPDEKWDPSVFQAHLPVRQQFEVVGHSVRAMYLYSAMADVYAETGDPLLLAALDKLWANMTGKRMYLTGGLGSTARYEGFTSDFDLPNEAYAETCAGIGCIFWNHRMLGLQAHSHFGDVIENTLYNNVLSGVGLDGASFFYENPLRRRNGGKERTPWYDCACCPPNVARLLASLGEYVCSKSPEGLWIHLYAGCTINADVNGVPVKLTQKTDYPWSGSTEITVSVKAAAEFAVCLRLPGWSREQVISVNGAPVQFANSNGYACIRRRWADGDKISLKLGMEPVRVEANPHVEADFAKVALRRGPLVYCLEEADNGRELFAVTLPNNAQVKAEFKNDVLGGVVLLEALAEMPDYSRWDGKLYREATARGASHHKMTAIPYCCWANRGAGEMIVWLNSAE